MNKKLMGIMIVLLTAILLAGAVIFIFIQKSDDTGDGKKAKEPSIDEIVEASVSIPEITTNLVTNDYVKISFTIQTDGKKAKEELEKRNFQVQNMLISELSEMKPADLNGKAGKKKLEETLKVKINELMQDGKVEKVYITSYIIS